MRIIAGEFRSRKLKTLEGGNTRPTQDKLRGAIFSSIGPYFDGQSFLDLFAGSGACGLEAKSRGCDYVVLNDKNPKASRIIKENVKDLKVKCEIYNLDYIQLLDQFKNYRFDYIFLDPPYKLKVINEILTIIDQNQMLSENGKIIVESSIEDTYGQLKFNSFMFLKEKEYRLTRITYFKYKKGE